MRKGIGVSERSGAKALGVGSVALALLLCVLAQPLLAQAAPAAPGETFRDWSVDCLPAGQSCTASTTSFAEDRTWLSTLRIQPGDGAEALPVQILVPPGVHLASGLYLKVPGQNLAEATYLRCTPRACDARVSLSNRQRASWERARAARLRYRPSPTAPPIEFEISLMGLTAALGAAAEANR